MIVMILFIIHSSVTKSGIETDKERQTKAILSLEDILVLNVKPRLPVKPLLFDIMNKYY